MIGSKSVLAIIPARGGSKGLPRKNLLAVGDKPLIAWTIEAALAACHIDRVIVSTDDDEIVEVARSWDAEVPFRRPAELADDHTSLIDVVLHALDEMEKIGSRFDITGLLQPTSPFRTSNDIDAALDLMALQDANSCVAVCETPKTPYWMFRLENGWFRPLLPGDQFGAQNAQRQEYPDVYHMNGAIYFARTAWFRQSQTFASAETLAYVMPRERSVDIDDHIDLDLVNLMLRKERYVSV